MGTNDFCAKCKVFSTHILYTLMGDKLVVYCKPCHEAMARNVRVRKPAVGSDRSNG